MFLVLYDVGAEELQSDGPFELRVFSLVDDTHAALAELFEDLVVTNDGTDHVAETVPLGVANGSEA